MPSGGSKKGERRGGRQKGTPNKENPQRAAQREMIRAIIGTDGDPMKVFIDILKAPDAPADWKFKAAEILMPFTYPKLASVEQRDGGSSHEERLRDYQRMLEEDAKPIVLEEEAIEVPLIEDKADGGQQPD